MAKKISELTPLLGSTFAADDQFVMVDKSVGETKRVDSDEVTTGLGLIGFPSMVVTGNLYFGGSTVFITSGAGTPEGSVTAPVGSLFTRTDGGAGTTLYVKESGASNTGWVAK